MDQTTGEVPLKLVPVAHPNMAEKGGQKQSKMQWYRFKSTPVWAITQYCKLGQHNLGVKKIKHTKKNTTHSC